MRGIQWLAAAALWRMGEKIVVRAANLCLRTLAGPALRGWQLATEEAAERAQAGPPPSPPAPLSPPGWPDTQAPDAFAARPIGGWHMRPGTPGGDSRISLRFTDSLILTIYHGGLTRHSVL